MTLNILKLNHSDICLFYVIHNLHKTRNEFYLSHIIKDYHKTYGKCSKKPMFKKIKELKEKGFLKFYRKDIKRGCKSIPLNVEITDKFLLFYNFMILATLLLHDEPTFKEKAIERLEQTLCYLKQVDK